MSDEQKPDQISVLDLSPAATFALDENHKVTHWNKACERLTGIQAVDVIGTDEHWRAFYPTKRMLLADTVMKGANEPDLQRLYGHAGITLSRTMPEAWEAEDFFPRLGADGCWLHFTAIALRDGNGKIVGAVETLLDVTTRKAAERRALDGEAFMSHALAGNSVATFIVGIDGKVTHWNRACETLTGKRAHDMVGTNDAWKAFYAYKRPVLAEMVMEGSPTYEIDKLYHGRFRQSNLVDGAWEAEDFFPTLGEDGLWIFFTAAPLRDSDGRLVGAIETLQDVTERHRAQEKLRHSEARHRALSEMDPLTDLMNARRLKEKLNDEVNRSRRMGRPLSILSLDADHFKSVNDNFGHAVGDELLKCLAQRISSELRRTDMAFRAGGEEFVVLLPDTRGETAFHVAERMRKSFETCRIKTTDGQEVARTLSIGVAELGAGEAAEDFLARADAASYISKEKGRNRVSMSE